MPLPLIPFALAGAASEGTATIIEKNILRNKKIGYKEYTVYGFLIISLLAFLFIAFSWKNSWIISPEAFELKNIIILLVIVICSGIANLLTFYAMKWEKITNLEPMRLFQPLFLIILAFIFYSSERHNSTQIIILSLIASLALIFSHIKKHHFQLNKYALATLFGSFFFALELALSKFILEYYSSMAFYFIRCTTIFLAMLIILKPSPKTIDGKSWFYMIIASAIWIIYRMLLYSGYRIYGVIFTTLIFILATVFIYILASVFLKEKLTLRNIIATIVILACVSYAIWAG